MTDTTTQAGSPPEDVAGAAVGTSTTETVDQILGEAGEEIADDTEEVEVGDQKYRVPKAVKPLLMTTADYTRKTQELADHRRAVEAERSTHGERVKADLQLIGEGREIIELEADIRRLKNLTPEEFQSFAPEQQNRVIYRLQQMEGELTSKRQAYAQKIQAKQSEAERDRATRRDQAAAQIAREVEGWSPAMQDTLRSFATKELGATSQDFETAQENPRLMKMLHLAHLGHQSVSKAKAAAAQAQPQPAPTRTVNGGSSSSGPSGPSDRQSVETWMAARKAQLRKR